MGKAEWNGLMGKNMLEIILMYKYLFKMLFRIKNMDKENLYGPMAENIKGNG